jgi:hypothetical protein
MLTVFKTIISSNVKAMLNIEAPMMNCEGFLRAKELMLMICGNSKYGLTSNSFRKVDFLF